MGIHILSKLLVVVDSHPGQDSGEVGLRVFLRAGLQTGVVIVSRLIAVADDNITPLLASLLGK